MTREDAVERLCDVYGGSFDITRCEEAELIDFWEGDCWYSDVTGHVYRIKM